MSKFMAPNFYNTVLKSELKWRHNLILLRSLTDLYVQTLKEVFPLNEEYLDLPLLAIQKLTTKPL